MGVSFNFLQTEDKSVPDSLELSLANANNSALLLFQMPDRNQDVLTYLDPRNTKYDHSL